MNKKNAKIIDVCCGGRMFYFDKENEEVHFCDIRSESVNFSGDRILHVLPDTVCDFTNLPFKNKEFKIAVFDPPHLIGAGKNSRMYKKYGRLEKGTWQEVLKKGFDECMRVIEDWGVLVFKWSEVQITTNKILEIFQQRPLIGHKSGKLNKTHWMLFIKTPQ